MKQIDLHVHSNFSDGTLSTKELVDLAVKNQISAISLTDHDTLDGVESALGYGKERGIEIIPGIELSCEYMGKDVHILGYFFQEEIVYDNEFKESLIAFQDSRDSRNEKMMSLLQKEGIDISLDKLKEQFGEPILTRAHVARYLLDHNYVSNMEQAFTKYIGDHSKCFVPREKITPIDGIQFIKKFKGLAVLAHPLLYKISDTNLEKLIAELSEHGLDGIEAIYSTNRGSEENKTKRFAAKYHLLITGGSDFHGSNKKDIDLGKGRGRLFVPYELLEIMKKKYQENFS